MKAAFSVVLSIGLLAGAGAASAENRVTHGARAVGEQTSRVYHGAARHGQKFLARHSWSRRRGYHLRKAAGHSEVARRRGHQAREDWNRATK